jgi:hypothetical protein
MENLRGNQSRDRVCGRRLAFDSKISFEFPEKTADATESK